MQNSWEQANEMRRLVDRHADHLLLLVIGFDGVIVDYDPNPDSVCLSPATRDLLGDLGARHDTALAVISGRRMHDVRARVGLGEDLFYIGLHGLEVTGPGFTRGNPEMVDRYRSRIHEIAGAFGDSSVVRGVVVEDKEAAVAVHTRGAGSRDAVWARLHILSAAADLVNNDELRAYRGNHVFELVPNVRAPRATAINAVRRFLEHRQRQPVFTVYVAEDVRDDDAFEAIAEPAVSAGVGGRAPQAHFRLASPEDVRQMLAGLADRTLDSRIGSR